MTLPWEIYFGAKSSCFACFFYTAEKWYGTMEDVENQWISLKIKHFDGFWRFHEIHEISKCDHDGYTRLELRGDVFTFENARFRDV